MSEFALPLLVTQSAFNIYGQYSKGKQYALQGKYEYELSKAEANAIEIEGQERLRQATEEAELIMKQGADLISSQIAGFTTSGVTLSGTVPIVLAETKAENKLAQSRVLREGLAAEAIAEYRANVTRAGGKVSKYAGQSAANSQYTRAGATALSDLAGIGNKLGWFDKPLFGGTKSGSVSGAYFKTKTGNVYPAH